ncbi:MAG TPA: cbb3-type cytochrome oxidase assembly protein CcoS [Polyangiaceae bacterium]|nr:cbb3-type cytochrome oxidase assembly protein CcoS [Polyangiaceae bacterium]
MSVLFVVLPLTLLISGLAVLAFSWATRRGQFDDLETPALRALQDEPRLPRVVVSTHPASSGRLHDTQ